MFSNSAKLALASSATALLVGLAAFLLTQRQSEPDVAEKPPLVERKRGELELRDGVLHAKEALDIPFDGLLVESYPHGQRKLAIEIADGRPHGWSRGWFDSGQREVEEFFVEGVSHGRRLRWHANGTLRSEADIVHGVLQGTFVEWHDNGIKAVEMTMTEGKPDGECRAWHPTGALKSVALMRQGTLVERKFFEDRTGPAAAEAKIETAALEAAE